jgi:hypothetical protein
MAPAISPIPAGFTDAIWNKAQEIGLPLELITAEYDTPQFEFTLTFDEAVEASSIPWCCSARWPAKSRWTMASC